MAELLPEDLRDRCRDLSTVGNCYLADDNDEIGGDPNYVRYVPTQWYTWESLTDESLQRVWLSPNGFEPSNAVGRSNAQYFMDKYGDRPGVIRTNFLGVAIRVADLTEEIMQEFVALQNYPVLDNDLYQQEQDEGQRESWDGWVKRDFMEALGSKFSKELGKEVELDDDDADEDKLFNLFCSSLGQNGGEWIEESCGGWNVYNMEAAIAAVSIEDCAKVGLGFSV